MLSTNRPTFATDAQWDQTKGLPLVHVMDAVFRDDQLQVWYYGSNSRLRVRSVDAQGNVRYDKPSRI